MTSNPALQEVFFNLLDSQSSMEIISDGVVSLDVDVENSAPVDNSELFLKGILGSKFQSSKNNLVF